MQVAGELIEKAVRHQDRPGWKHIYSRRGDEMRLKQKVKVKESDRNSSAMGRPQELSTAREKEKSFESMTLQAFNSPEPAEDLEMSEEAAYVPEAPIGSFVEIRR
jgi:hypothetical protein